MNKLKVGFSRVNINPPLGIGLQGYFIERFAENVLDDLEINAVAFECEKNRIVMLSADILGIKQGLLNKIRKAIAEKTGLSTESIYFHCVHVHTGPIVREEDDCPLIASYIKFLTSRAVDAAVLALNDLKDAKMGYGKGTAPNIAFVRRYVMKDGTIRTNPGVNNPDIVKPAGDGADEGVNVIRFNRENADDIVIASFACHPDGIGGNNISADWPGFLRRTVEKILDNTKCIFFNGAQGDVNHVNVRPKGGDFNDMFVDFDDVTRGYGHARYMGRVVAGGVLQAFDKVEYVDVDKITAVNKTINLPSNMPRPDQIDEAIRVNNLHLAGRDSELPYTGMMLTTVVAEAARIVRLKDGPETFPMTLAGIMLGPVAFIGIPGEPFSEIGRALKADDTVPFVTPTCITNGYEGYFPMMDSYDEGGYEARRSDFKAGVAERIIQEGKLLLKEMKAKL